MRGELTKFSQIHKSCQRLINQPVTHYLSNFSQELSRGQHQRGLTLAKERQGDLNSFPDHSVSDRVTEGWTV